MYVVLVLKIYFILLNYIFMQFSWVINKFALNKCPFLGFIVNYNVQVLLISFHYQLIICSFLKQILYFAYHFGSNH